MTDTRRCRDCELLLTGEDDLCDVCQTDYINWLEQRYGIGASNG